MKIGYSYWGFCEEYKDSSFVDTPDGGRFVRPIFVKEALKRGDKVVALQIQREKNPINGLKFSQEFPKIDVLFIEWRWPTWKNQDQDPKEPDLKRQWELIQYYSKKEIPIIIWECDAKITKTDHNALLNYSKNFIMTMSSLEPYDTQFATFESMPYFMDYNDCSDEVNYRKSNLIYIGNNYEREYQFEKYYYYPSKLYVKHTQGVEPIAEVYGNWLQKSPERLDPSIINMMYGDFVKFGPRVSFKDTLKILNESGITIHILKEEYCKRKMITSRFFEAMYCNLLSFTPEEFEPVFGQDFITKGKFDTFIRIKEIFDKKTGSDYYKALVNLQKKIIREKYPETDIRNWYNKFKKLAKGERP